MRMHEEGVEVSEAGKPSENGEPSNQGVQETPDLTISQKYKELRSRLKYLIYEHRCFESELNKAQSRLIELSQDKTVLLDQLLQYEPVSGEEEEITDYSGSEDEVPSDSRLHRPPVPVAKLEVSGVPSSSQKSLRQPSHSPIGGSPLPPPSKPANLTKQGIAKATAIINSVSNNIASKAGTKRQAKKPGSGGMAPAVKISKTISRVRQNNVPDTPSTLVGAGLAAGKQKFVVSYPITSISTTEAPTPAGPAPTLTTHTVSTVSTSIAPPAASKPLSRPIPALTKAQPPPLAPSSSLHISSVGSVRVSAISAPRIPPLIPDTGKGRSTTRNSSSSASSTSSSSSSSDSGESGSDLSSGSEDEAMDTENTRGGGVGKGPVQIVSSVKSSSDLPRPKAILSPVKMAPPMLLRGGVPTPPPAVISPQPAFSGWNQSQGMSSNEGHSPLMSSEVGGFAPVVSSPSSALPFSSLNNPGAGASAFQVFSPKYATHPSQTALPHSSSASSMHAVKTTPSAKVDVPNSANHSTKS